MVGAFVSVFFLLLRPSRRLKVLVRAHDPEGLQAQLPSTKRGQAPHALCRTTSSLHTRQSSPQGGASPGLLIRHGAGPGLKLAVSNIPRRLATQRHAVNRCKHQQRHGGRLRPALLVEASGQHAHADGILQLRLILHVVLKRTVLF